MWLHVPGRPTWFSLGPVSSDHLYRRASALGHFLWKRQQVIEHEEDGDTSLLGLLARVSAHNHRAPSMVPGPRGNAHQMFTLSCLHSSLPQEETLHSWSHSTTKRERTDHWCQFWGRSQRKRRLSLGREEERSLKRRKLLLLWAHRPCLLWLQSIYNSFLLRILPVWATFPRKQSHAG